jgi:hypothetical protein
MNWTKVNISDTGFWTTLAILAIIGVAGVLLLVTAWMAPVSLH